MFYYQWGQFQTHASHVVPSTGPIVLVVTLHGWQNSLEKQTSQLSLVMPL